MAVLSASRRGVSWFILNQYSLGEPQIYFYVNFPPDCLCIHVFVIYYATVSQWEREKDTVGFSDDIAVYSS